MATNQHALLRQWHMLRAIPRAPRSITVQTLMARLADEDFIVSGRTIQRDLVELAQVFPLQVDEGSKPFGWSWLADSPSFDLPGLSVPEALTLTLVAQQLTDLLPPATLDALQPHFRSARQRLAAIAPQATANAWLGKVRAIAPMQHLLPPQVNEDCQRVVYDALMQDRQLKLGYRKRDTLQIVQYESVHPLALIQRGQIIYLVCMFAGYEDVRRLALHRVVSAEMLFADSRRKADFDLDAYVASGNLGIRNGDPIVLRAVFARSAGEHLYETPLSAQQQLLPLDEDRLELVATVPNTRELQWWLLGLGEGVEVMEPPELRAEMGRIAAQMARRYQAPLLA